MSGYTLWQKQHLDSIRKQSNIELVNNVISQAQGDDYDGAMTQRGYCRFTASCNELEKRLRAVGFISETEIVVTN